NLDEIEQAVAKYDIDCSFERTGELAVATEPWQVPGLAEDEIAYNELGQDVRLLGRDAVRDEVDSPTYLGGLWHRDGTAMLNPARLAWGLRAACLGLGVRIHEHTYVRGVHGVGGRLRVDTAKGSVDAARAVLGTGAF